MAVEIEIEERTLELLDKYCNSMVRPALIGPLMGRILEGWYARAAKVWAENPKLIPILEPIGEGKTMKLNIKSEDARLFLKTLDNFNKKLGKSIDPCALANWLAMVFIKAYDLRELARYKMRMGRIKKI